MTLWLVLSALLVLAVVVVARPFFRHAGGVAGGSGQDVEMFREQIREIDADVERGVMTAAEAAATRREVELRLLAVLKVGEGATLADNGEKARVTGLAIVSGAIAVGSVGLFAVLRDDGPPLPQVTASAPAPAPAAPDGAGAGSVDSMIAGLAKRLETDTDDLEGWKMLGWSYLRTGNLAGAVEAYARALTLNDADPELHALYGEALTRAAGGRIDDAALAAFEASLVRAPGNPRAGFFKGMAMDQRGDTKAALEWWLAMLARAPADADWRPGLVERIRERAGATGFDLGPYPGLAPDGFSGPSAADVEAAQQMSGEDRAAMIRGMVEGLAARLAEDPQDAEGWARLIRSYGVLGDPAAASAALASARAAFPEGSAGRAEIERAAAGAASQ